MPGILAIAGPDFGPMAYSSSPTPPAVFFSCPRQAHRRGNLLKPSYESDVVVNMLEIAMSVLL
jgi:hypothetical protein